MTAIDFGMKGGIRAWREHQIFSPSTGAKGRLEGLAPVAMMICAACSTLTEPSSAVTSTCLPGSMRPVPCTSLTPALLKRNSMPRLIVAATSRLRVNMRSMSGWISPAEKPYAAPSRAWLSTCALLSRALVGIQPQLRHTPPSDALSTTVTSKPAFAASSAAT